MEWHSVAVVLGCRMAFGSSGAGLWDIVLLRWCWVVGWHSVALGCGMAFFSGGAGLWDGIRRSSDGLWDCVR